MFRRTYATYGQVFIVMTTEGWLDILWTASLGGAGPIAPLYLAAVLIVANCAATRTCLGRSFSDFIVCVIFFSEVLLVLTSLVCYVFAQT